MNAPGDIRVDPRTASTGWPELIARLRAADRATAIQLALGAACTQLDAEQAVVIEHGEAGGALVQAARHGVAQAQLPGLGAADVARAAIDDPDLEWLAIARHHRSGFTAADQDRLDAIAAVLSLTLALERSGESERSLTVLRQQESAQRKRAERELVHRSLHDPLTGLANRSLVRERAGHALERARHGSGYVAVLYVDIDHFKLTNDALDHERGDRLLAALAQRLSAILSLEDNDRFNCTLGRPGGDEFIVLGEDLASEHEAVTVAEQIRVAISAPFFVDGQSVTLTASVGIACVAGSEADATDADMLLRDADVALSRAKERGRDRYEIFDEPMRARLLDRVALEADLRAALQNDELRLLYQPVVTVSDGGLAAVEALIRWQHPTRGLLGPGEFIAVAEESELIVSVGAWVIEEACEQLRRWRDAHPAKLSVRMSVNVSARQLSPALVDTVAVALEHSGVAPAQLALEITETLLIEHTESAREVLASLAQLGVTIVLDDFGTGYSSLGYLNEFPLGQLKLDRSFTAELARETRSAKIVAATIDMARAMGMTVVAEGVETVEQVDVLQRLGCDYAQGFLFARPEAADAVFERIRAAYDHDRELARQPAAPRQRPQAPAAAPDPERQHAAAVGRVFGWMFLVGGTAGPATGPLVGANLGISLSLGAISLLTALGCLTVPWRRISPLWLNLPPLIATVEIMVASIAYGSSQSVLEPTFLLVAISVAYTIRSRRMIAAQMLALTGAMSAAALAGPSTAGALGRAIPAVTSMICITMLVATLRERLEANSSELRDLAARDPLTNVGNYRMLHERLDYELRRHERRNEELAVLLIDLDRFKQVNERRGHAAGDDILRRVAQTLREAVRQHDTVARQGGDEFAVLAPATNAEGAAMLAARIRARLSRVQFAGDSIGATIGWAVYPADGRNAGELLARADEVLMNGKLTPRATSEAVPALALGPGRQAAAPHGPGPAAPPGPGPEPEPALT